MSDFKGPPKKRFKLSSNAALDNAGHHHRMENHSFGLNDAPHSSNQKETNPTESTLLSVQRRIEYLLHACRCRDANCTLPSCQKTKQDIEHAKSCNQKTNGDFCPICKQLVAECIYHCEHCQEAVCHIWFCNNVKEILREDRNKTTVSLSDIVSQILSIGNSNSSSQPSPDAQPHLPPHPPQSDIGIKLSTIRPDGAVQNHHSSYALPAVMPHPSPSIGSIQELRSPELNFIRGCALSSQRNRCVQPHQPTLHSPNPAVNPGILPRPRAQVQHTCRNRILEAWRQLLELVRLPLSDQTRVLIVNHLRSNPPLYHAFIRGRQQQRHTLRRTLRCRG